MKLQQALKMYLDGLGENRADEEPGLSRNAAIRSVADDLLFLLRKDGVDQMVADGMLPDEAKGVKPQRLRRMIKAAMPKSESLKEEYNEAVNALDASSVRSVIAKASRNQRLMTATGICNALRLDDSPANLRKIAKIARADKRIKGKVNQSGTTVYRLG